MAHVYIPSHKFSKRNPTLRNYSQKLTPSQIQKASEHSRLAYPQKMPCANCGRMWMAHKGLLCPIRDGQVSPIINPANGLHYIDPPVFGDKLFIPDEEYYNQNPDYEVTQ